MGQMSQHMNYPQIYNHPTGGHGQTLLYTYLNHQTHTHPHQMGNGMSNSMGNNYMMYPSSHQRYWNYDLYRIIIYNFLLSSQCTIILLMYWQFYESFKVKKYRNNFIRNHLSFGGTLFTFLWFNKSSYLLSSYISLYLYCFYLFFR